MWGTLHVAAWARPCHEWCLAVVKELITFQELADRVCGKTISYVLVSPLRWNETGEVGICEGAVFLTDGFVVPLSAWGLEAEGACFSTEVSPELLSPECQQHDELAGVTIESVVVALHIFSLGLLVSGGRVVCLDFVGGQGTAYQCLTCLKMADVMDGNALKFTGLGPACQEGEGM